MPYGYIRIRKIDILNVSVHPRVLDYRFNILNSGAIEFKDWIFFVETGLNSGQNDFMNLLI